MILSPLFLVRLLPVSEYGSYREYLLYFGLLLPFVSFAIARSLPFLIPKYPEKERTWITQTVLFVLTSSVVVILALYLLGDIIRANTSFDFVAALQLYVFFFVNLDFLECYWLGKKRANLILYYSVARLSARTGLVIVLAYLTGDAEVLVYGLILLEVVRWLLVLAYSIYRRWFTRNITKPDLKLQASFFVPLGGGAIVEQINTNAGMLFISIMIGPEALAFYAIGKFSTKILEVLRGAIADAIFPDIVEIKSKVAKDALPLWLQATVWYCILIFPIAILFSYYADAIVTVLFTAEYNPAIPVFAIFSLLLANACFDFHLPLRAQNANRYFFIGTILALALNLALIYPFYLAFGFLGPALAFAVSGFAKTIYLATCTMTVYDIRVAELIRWREVGKVLIASLVGLPVLVAGKMLVDNFLLRAVIFGGAYLLVYLFVLRIAGVWDVLDVVRAVAKGRRS